MKIGCCISFEHIELAKTFGYDYVELSAREIMRMDEVSWMKKIEEILHADIPILGFSAFADKNTPIIGPFADEKLWSAYVDTVLVRAAQLQVKYIGIGAPNARMIPPDYDYEQASNEMEYFLSKVATLASNYNITILYEALNPKECNFGNHTLEIYNTIQKLNLPNLNIVYDVYHAINAYEIYEDARPFFNKIKHIHINSWDQDLNRYFLFEKDTSYMRKLCIFLNSVHYDDTISVEAFDADFVQTGAASVMIMKEAIAFANNTK